MAPMSAISPPSPKSEDIFVKKKDLKKLFNGYLAASPTKMGKLKIPAT
jgi:hypothetical protein